MKGEERQRDKSGGRGGKGRCCRCGQFTRPWRPIGAAQTHPASKQHTSCHTCVPHLSHTCTPHMCMYVESLNPGQQLGKLKRILQASSTASHDHLPHTCAPHPTHTCAPHLPHTSVQVCGVSEPWPATREAQAHPASKQHPQGAPATLLPPWVRPGFEFGFNPGFKPGFCPGFKPCVAGVGC